jgi:hypothetical protein
MKMNQVFHTSYVADSGVSVTLAKKASQSVGAYGGGDPSLGLPRGRDVEKVEVEGLPVISLGSGSEVGRSWLEESVAILA